MGGRVVSGIAIVLSGRVATILLQLIVPYLWYLLVLVPRLLFRVQLGQTNPN